MDTHDFIWVISSALQWAKFPFSSNGVFKREKKNLIHLWQNTENTLILRKKMKSYKNLLWLRNQSILLGGRVEAGWPFGWNSSGFVGPQGSFWGNMSILNFPKWLSALDRVFLEKNFKGKIVKSLLKATFKRKDVFLNKKEKPLTPQWIHWGTLAPLKLWNDILKPNKVFYF